MLITDSDLNAAPEAVDLSSGNLLTDTALDLLRAPGYGAARFGQSIADIVDTGIEAFTPWEGFNDAALEDEALPEWLRPRTVFGQFGSAATQFGLGFIPGAGIAGWAGKAASATRFLSSQTRFAKVASYMVSKPVLGSAVADFIAFKGDEGNLSGVVQSVGEQYEIDILNNGLIRFLANDEDDSWVEGRFKNMLDGLAFGSAIDGVLRSSKVLRKHLKAVESGDEAAIQATKQEFETIKQQAAQEKETLSSVGSVEEAAPAASPPPRRPEPSDPDFGRVRPLNAFSETIYRETSLEDGLYFIPGGINDAAPREFFFSLTEDLALGQGTNKGVIFELDASKVKGRIDTSKPAWEYLYDSGQAEVVAKNNKQKDMVDAVKSFTIKKDATGDLLSTRRFKALSEDLINKGWKKETLDDGSVKFTKEADKVTPSSVGKDSRVSPVQRYVAPPEELVKRVDEAISEGATLDEAVGDVARTFINYDTLDADTQAEALIRHLEPLMYNQRERAFGGPRSLEESAQRAESLAKSPEQLSGVTDTMLIQGDDFGPAVLVMKGLAKTYYNMAVELKLKGDMKGYHAAMKQAMDLTTLWGEMQRKLGRGLSDLRNAPPEVQQADDLLNKLRNIRENPNADATIQALQAVRGASDDPAFDKAIQDYREELVEQLIHEDRAGQTGQTARLVKRVAPRGDSTIKAILEFRKAALLSGIPTFGINVVSGAWSTLTHPLFRAIGSFAELNPQEAMNSLSLYIDIFGAFGDMVRATGVDGGASGFGGLGKAFSEETGATFGRTAMELDNKAITGKAFGIEGKVGKAVDVAGKGVRLPFMLNMGAEEFYSQLNFLAYLRNQGKAKAKELVASGKLKHTDVPEFVDNYNKAFFDADGKAYIDEAATDETLRIFNEASQYARSANFMQSTVDAAGNGVGFGERISKLKQTVQKDNPYMYGVLDMILPFVKAPSNIIASASRLTPGLGAIEGIAQRQLRKAGRRVHTKDEILRHNGERVLGMALGVTFAGMAASGKMTGYGPRSASERQRLMDTGWQPYSFVTTDAEGNKKYISFARMDPIASVMGVMADLGEVSSSMSPSERDDVANRVMQSFAFNFTSKTYMKGLSDALAAMTAPDRNAQRFAQNVAGSFVPNIIARSTSFTDPHLREARTIIDAVKRRTPGFSENLPPRRNILGEAVQPTGNRLYNFASPFQTSNNRQDFVTNELADMEYGISQASPRIAGLDLTKFKTKDGGDAYDRYLELTGSIRINGRNLRAQMNRAMKSSRFKNAPPPTGDPELDKYNPRVKAVQRILSSYRKAAQAQLFEENPQLRQRSQSIRRQGVTGTLSTLSQLSN